MMRCPKLYKILSAVNFLLLVLWLTYPAAGQIPSAVDTIQNYEISAARDLAESDSARIDKLSTEVETLKVDAAQTLGNIKGFGWALVVIQGIQAITAWKRSRA